MNATSRAPVLKAGQFYGVSDEVWRTDLVTLTVLSHATPRAVPMHSHAHMYIALLLEGGYREWVGDDEIVYQPLTAVFHPANHEHRDEITRPQSRFFTIEIDPAMVGDRAYRALRSVHDLSGGPAVWSMLRLLEAVRGHRRDAIEGEEPVVEILDRLLADDMTDARPRWLARVDAALEDDFAEPVSLHALAAIAGVHPVHLARVYRRHHGSTIRAAVRARRVLAAARAITTGTAIADAAATAGFCDQSHMTHAFRAVTGLTPARYRALAGKRSAR